MGMSRMGCVSTVKDQRKGCLLRWALRLARTIVIILLVRPRLLLVCAKLESRISMTIKEVSILDEGARTHVFGVCFLKGRGVYNFWARV